MHLLERSCVRLRHARPFNGMEWLWNLVRPVYNFAVKTGAKSGLPRVINGTDPLLVAPELRGITEVYEPDVWPRVMSALQPGDVFVDVGAYVGLYAVAAAKRVGPTGHVYAFEPNPESFELLRRQISLNRLSNRIEAHQAAVASQDGFTPFTGGHSVQSHITGNAKDGISVKVCRLDSVLAESKVDIIKIDVEGFEEKVLQGAERLLSDEQRKPRLMFIEVHPYNWHLCRTTSQSLIHRLRRCGYEVCDLQNESVAKVDRYGEVVAKLA